MSPVGIARNDFIECHYCKNHNYVQEKIYLKEIQLRMANKNNTQILT